MNVILTSLQHDIDFHIDHDSDMGTNIISTIFNSDKVFIRWREIEMNYVINGNKPWILCTCEADTPNVNRHSNKHHTEWQTEHDQATAPTTFLDNSDAEVGTLIKIPVGGHRAAAAAMINKTPTPVAVGPTPIKMADNGTSLEVKMVVTRAWKASWWVIAITMTMNYNPHL